LERLSTAWRAPSAREKSKQQSRFRIYYTIKLIVIYIRHTVNGAGSVGTVGGGLLEDGKPIE